MGEKCDPLLLQELQSEASFVGGQHCRGAAKGAIGGGLVRTWPDVPGLEEGPDQCSTGLL